MNDDSRTLADRHTLRKIIDDTYSVSYEITSKVILNWLNKSNHWRPAPHRLIDRVDSQNTVTLSFFLSPDCGYSTIGIRAQWDQSTLTDVWAQENTGLSCSGQTTITATDVQQAISLTGPCTILGVSGSSYELEVDGTNVSTFPQSVTSSAVLNALNIGTAMTIDAVTEPITLVTYSIGNGRAATVGIGTVHPETATIWLSQGGSPYGQGATVLLTVPSAGEGVMLPITIVDADGNVVHHDPTFKVQHVNGGTAGGE